MLRRKEEGGEKGGDKGGVEVGVVCDAFKEVYGAPSRVRCVALTRLGLDGLDAEHVP